VKLRYYSGKETQLFLSNVLQRALCVTGLYDEAKLLPEEPAVAEFTPTATIDGVPVLA
jgi:hypothetical protein